MPSGKLKDKVYQDGMKLDSISHVTLKQIYMKNKVNDIK